MLKKILVSLDRSALAEQALGRAIAIARGIGAELDLVLVHRPFLTDGTETDFWRQDDWRAESKYLETTAAEVLSGSGVSATCNVSTGEPVDMICKRAWEIDADLVVLTSHGRTGWSRAWLGSVADGVMRHSAVPVLMLPASEPANRYDTSRHAFKKILVPVDGSSLSESVIDSARAIAKACGARITLLRVIQPVPLIIPEIAFAYALPPLVPDEDATKGLVAQATEEIKELGHTLREDGADVDAHVVVAENPAVGIIDYARGHGCDLIAMSTHGRGASRLAFGSVADKVLRGSGCALLIHRPLGVQATAAATAHETMATSE